DEPDEEARVVAALNLDSALRAIAVRSELDEPAERVRRIDENLLGSRGVHEELDLRRVLAPLIHAGTRRRRSLRPGPRTRPPLLAAKDAQDRPRRRPTPRARASPRLRRRRSRAASPWR